MHCHSAAAVECACTCMAVLSVAALPHGVLGKVHCAHGMVYSLKSLAIPFTTHRSQGARARPGDGLAVLGGGHDASGANEHHVLAAELLLQLAHEARLDFVEGLQQAVGHLNACVKRDELLVCGELFCSLCTWVLLCCCGCAVRARRREGGSTPLMQGSHARSAHPDSPIAHTSSHVR